MEALEDGASIAPERMGISPTPGDIPIRSGAMEALEAVGVPPRPGIAEGGMARVELLRPVVSLLRPVDDAMYHHT